MRAAAPATSKLVFVTACQASWETSAKKSVLQGTMEKAVLCTVLATLMPDVTHRMDTAPVLLVEEAMIAQHHANQVSGAKAASLHACARTALWAVIQSTASVCVRQATLENTVKKTVQMPVMVMAVLNSASVKTEPTVTM